jgi:aminoglycoside 2'-N-acetyltransferase I
LNLHLQVIQSSALPDATRAAIVALCDRAYGREMASYLNALPNPTHVIGSVGGVIVSHAMWVTRAIQAGDGPPLRTAYVELVATEPAQQRRGYAAAVMRRLAASVAEFDLAALCPSDAGAALYPALGWQYWRGPLFIRGPQALLATPDERVMILELPLTPHLDLDAPLSAEWREGELW